MVSDETVDLCGSSVPNRDTREPVLQRNPAKMSPGRQSGFFCSPAIFMQKIECHLVADLLEDRVADAWAKLEAWRQEYNESRTHRALNSQTPTEYAVQWN